MRLNKISLAAMVLGGSALLAACGSGGDNLEPDSVAATNATASINPANGPAVVSSVLEKDFVFGSGVPSFGTTTATTLKLSGTGAAPTFAITSAQGNASGNMTYGSCIFNVNISSTFATGQVLAFNEIVPVTPCELSIATDGQPADGRSFTVGVSLVLGTTHSTPIFLTASISPSGVVTVNGVVVANVSLRSATGGGN